MLSRRDKGRQAEDLAADYLARRGLKVLTRNFFGRRGEIDIIAREGDVLCIVEVRSRGKDSAYPAESSLTAKKIRRLSSAARQFLRKYRVEKTPVRFDLLVVDYQSGDPEIKFYPGGIQPCSFT